MIDLDVSFSNNLFTYKLNESLIPIGSNIALRVDDCTKWLPEFNQLIFSAFPRQVSQMKNLRRRLRVSKLWLAWNGRHWPSDLRPINNRNNQTTKKKKKDYKWRKQLQYSMKSAQDISLDLNKFVKRRDKSDANEELISSRRSQIAGFNQRSTL